MDKIIGFIGSGNMASAMIGGIINSKLVSSSNVICSNPTITRLEELKSLYGVTITTDNCEVASKSDILFLSVKPQFYPEVIKEIKECVNENIIVVSIAAGQKIENVKKLFQKDIKIVRAMPNTPALVGEGMAALSPCPMVLSDELKLICNIFNSFGKCEVIPENLMDVVTAVSGSSPAFIFMIIEAMADGAVLEGMPREKAYTFAAQTVLGSAKMVLETGEHPGKLKDMVCSPGGTTIEGVSVLEEKGLRTSFIKAIQASSKKSKDLSK